MKSLFFCSVAILLEAVYCATIVGKLAGDRRILIQVDISPATFKDAFVVLHVDGQHAGVMCPHFHPTDCFSSSAPDNSRSYTASTYISIDTSVLASVWNDAAHMVYASVESHFGRHLAFASSSVVSSGSKHNASPSTFMPLNERDADSLRSMNIVIFSKDRPSQLDLLTRSLKR
jgi:hypothetical protein